MTMIFIIFSSLMIIYQYKREKNIINLISILMAPYVIIVLFNNFLFCKMGFYKIEDEPLFMILSAFIVFFVGSWVAAKTTKRTVVSEKNTEFQLVKYNLKKIKRFLWIIAIASFVKIIYGLRIGEIFNEGYMGGGILGHLLLLSYSLVPIVFLYWTYNKKKVSCLILVLFYLIISFSSFIKYNVISLVVIIFLYLTMARKSLVKKAVILLVSFVMILFVLNYAIGFYAQQVRNVPSTFYLNHFWTYCAGALINANTRFVGTIGKDISVIHKLMIYFFALPNMFLNKLGMQLFPWDGALDFTNYQISITGNYSNVVDAVTRLYPNNRDLLEVLIFYVVVFGVGFFFMRLYSRWKRKELSPSLPIFLTYFVFLSFFGTFYMLPGPWETLVWSLFIPKLFENKKRVDFKYKRLYGRRI